MRDFTIPTGATIQAINDGKAISIQYPTPAIKIVPAELYVQDLTEQRDALQAKLDEINAKLDEITNQGVDVAAIQGKEV